MVLSGTGSGLIRPIPPLAVLHLLDHGLIIQAYCSMLDTTKRKIWMWNEKVWAVNLLSRLFLRFSFVDGPGGAV